MTTFILRVAGVQDGSLRGTVSHAATGETQTFAETAQLLAFLMEWTAASGMRATAADWQSFATPNSRRATHRAAPCAPRDGSKNP